MKTPTRTASASREASTEEGSPGDGGAQALSVLLVDDDAAVRAAVGRVIARMGHRVLAHGDAESALQEESFDVGLIDLNLGEAEEDGLVLLKSLRAQRPGADFVLTSGACFDDHETMGLDETVLLLRKPFGRVELIKLFEHLTEGR